MSQDEYFRFVKELATDLNRKEVKLPSFPDAVVKIRRALDDPECSADDLANILSSEPVLASRVLVFANSSYHNPAGTKIGGLNAAVGRVGFQKVRSAAISYAVEQLHDSAQFAPLKSELQKSWESGQRIAALSEVIAKMHKSLNSDSAFIAGLLHHIGSLYIFTKYEAFPDLLSSAEARQQLIDEWEGPIGESIVSNWDFSHEIRATFAANDSDADSRRVDPNLADVVAAAATLLSGDEIEFTETIESQRLKIVEDEMEPIKAAYQQKLESMSSAVAA